MSGLFWLVFAVAVVVITFEFLHRGWTFFRTASSCCTVAEKDRPPRPDVFASLSHFHDQGGLDLVARGTHNAHKIQAMNIKRTVV
jgi:hypothetical protein